MHDPHHALYGRRFAVLRRWAHQPGKGIPVFEVIYRDGVTLLIAEAACLPRSGNESNIKLSVEGLREMVSLVEAPDEHADRPRSSMGDDVAGVATPHRGGTRRNSGRGDAP